MNYNTGDDAYDGTDPVFKGGTVGPKKRISAAIDLVPHTNTNQITINLAGTVASPMTYEEDEEEVSISYYRSIEGGAVTICPGIWNETNYEAGDDPYDSGGSWDPTADKPCIVPPFKLEQCDRFFIKGLYFLPANDALVVGVLADNTSVVDLHYVRCEHFNAGVVAQGSTVEVFNSFMFQNVIGIAAVFGTVIISGENYIQDQLEFGVGGTIKSTVIIRAWEEMPFEKFVTKIRSTAPMNTYSALGAMVDSTIFIESDKFHMMPRANGRVLVLNELFDNNPNYTGVKLESRSCLVGMRNVAFFDKDLLDGKLTVPEENQFQGNAAEGTTFC